MSATPATTAAAEPLPDRARLSQLFADNYAFIWRLVRRLGLGAEAADDATQQAFLIAAERLADIRVGSERSFLYGTALRLCADLRRAELRMVRDSGSELESHQATVEDRIDEGRALRVLDAVLAAMEPELREVFVLFELERLGTQQIADLVGIPAGTVASRLRRARERFQTLSKKLSRPQGGAR